MAVVKTSTSGKLECYAWRSEYNHSYRISELGKGIWRSLTRPPPGPGHSRRESISTDTSEDRDGAEQMEKESSAPSFSGLFQLDDSCEACPSVDKMGVPVARILTWPWLTSSLHTYGQYMTIDSIKRALPSALGATRQWQGCKAA
nr:uncharacterized protein LOC118973507 isoform X3 [Manis javanica]